MGGIQCRPDELFCQSACHRLDRSEKDLRGHAGRRGVCPAGVSVKRGLTTGTGSFSEDRKPAYPLLLITLPKKLVSCGWRRAGRPECGLSLQPSLRGFDGERRPHVGAARRQDPPTRRDSSPSPRCGGRRGRRERERRGEGKRGEAGGG